MFLRKVSTVIGSKFLAYYQYSLYGYGMARAHQSVAGSDQARRFHRFFSACDKILFIYI